MNKVIEMVLEIGNTGKLNTDIDWYETREKWMLAGNPVYSFVREIGELDIYDPKASGKRKGIAIIKEEFLHALQKWCSDQPDYDVRLIPDSVKDVTQLIDACGWETDEQRTFGRSDSKKRCYIIPYKWKKDHHLTKYWITFTDETHKIEQNNF